jgi:hypothetical protein
MNRFICMFMTMGIGYGLWKGLSEYFRFYNREKLHQSPGYCPPGTCFYEKDAGGERLKTA